MQAWRRLTPRGRIVGVFGLLAGLAGVVFTQRDLFWLGAFAFAVVIGALLMVSWPVKGLRHERRLAVTSVPVGTEFGVWLTLTSSGGGLPRMLHFEDVVPPSMGIRPRFALSGGIPSDGYRVGYRLTGAQRGRFRIGPLLVRSLDPFGLARNDMAFVTTTEIAVTPKIYELGGLRAGSSGSSAEARSARAGLVGQDDVLVREYRRGDDVRRVHWRSTARAGELMVRREEQSWQPTTRLLVDNRRCAHVGGGPDSSFEWAVSAAASAGLALLGAGSILELADADGLSLSPDSDRSVRSQHLLYELTDITLTSAESLAAGLFAGGENRLPSSSVLAVLGQLTDADLATLIEATPRSGSAHALLLDVQSFAGGSSRSAQARYAVELANRGWMVTLVTGSTTVPQAWTALHEATEVLA